MLDANWPNCMTPTPKTVLGPIDTAGILQGLHQLQPPLYEKGVAVLLDWPLGK